MRLTIADLLEHHLSQADFFYNELSASVNALKSAKHGTVACDIDELKETAARHAGQLKFHLHELKVLRKKLAYIRNV